MSQNVVRCGSCSSTNTVMLQSMYVVRFWKRRVTRWASDGQRAEARDEQLRGEGHQRRSRADDCRGTNEWRKTGIHWRKTIERKKWRETLDFGSDWFQLVESSHTVWRTSQNNRERREFQTWTVQLCKRTSRAKCQHCAKVDAAFTKSYQRLSKHFGHCKMLCAGWHRWWWRVECRWFHSVYILTCQLCNSRNRQKKQESYFHFHTDTLRRHYDILCLSFLFFWEWSVEVCSAEKLELKALWSEAWRQQTHKHP